MEQPLLNQQPQIQAIRIPHLNTLVIKQKFGQSFFVAASNSIVISVPTLAFIIKFLVMNNFISPKVLEGILEEYYGTIK